MWVVSSVDGESVFEICASRSRGHTRGECRSVRFLVSVGGERCRTRGVRRSAPPRPDGLVGRGCCWTAGRLGWRTGKRDVRSWRSNHPETMGPKDVKNERAKISPHYFPLFLPLIQTPKHPLSNLVRRPSPTSTICSGLQPLQSVPQSCGGHANTALLVLLQYVHVNY